MAVCAEKGAIVAQLISGSAANWAVAWAHLQGSRLAVDERLVMLVLTELAAPGEWRIDLSKLSDLTGLDMERARSVLLRLRELGVLSLHGDAVRFVAEVAA